MLKMYGLDGQGGCSFRVLTVEESEGSKNFFDLEGTKKLEEFFHRYIYADCSPKEFEEAVKALEAGHFTLEEFAQLVNATPLPKRRSN